MFMTKHQVDQVKDTYPPGTQIEVINMTDPYSPIAPGTIGTVDLVDSMGTIHCTFDNGRILGVIPGEDSFSKITELEQTRAEKSKYLSELSRVLKTYNLQSEISGKGLLVVKHDNKTICYVSEAADTMRRSEDVQSSESDELAYKVQATAQRVKEYVTALESASPLVAEGLDPTDNFRLLCEYNGVVLAGREFENEQGYQFVTWQRTYGNTGLTLGHYYNDKYDASKEDFARRTGLVPSFKLWNTEQLGEIYKAIRYALENDSGMSVQQEQTLTHIKQHIEYENLDIAEPEHQEDISIHMNMT